VLAQSAGLSWLLEDGDNEAEVHASVLSTHEELERSDSPADAAAASATATAADPALAAATAHARDPLATQSVLELLGNQMMARLPRVSCRL
jgi:hypothetical protein